MLDVISVVYLIIPVPYMQIQHFLLDIWVMKETTQKVMKLSIMVTTISLMLNFPLRNPAIAPSPAPPMAAAISINERTSKGEGMELLNSLTRMANRTAYADSAPV